MSFNSSDIDLSYRSSRASYGDCGSCATLSLHLVITETVTNGVLNVSCHIMPRDGGVGLSTGSIITKLISLVIVMDNANVTASALTVRHASR